ncbi:MAG: efflux transporter outer membrane subunit [Deltaproteobacteria bacterium]|nr:efflux transporter outer membrane subunit [Deltaproteobacteria bacterium]
MIFASFTLFTGCAVGPNYVPDEPETPDVWHQELTRGLATGEVDLRTWWKIFGDPQIDTLIERASGGNLDVQESLARVMETRARVGFAKGEYFPDTNAGGEIARTRPSKGISQNMPPPANRHDTLYATGLDAVWEMDVWGRIRRSVESADADMQASIEDYRDVQVTLYAEVALNYVEIRALQTRIDYALGNVKTQSDALKLTQDRRDAGIGSDLEVSQAELNLARTESAVPSLRQRLAEAIHRLGVLMGEPPNALYAELSEHEPIPAPEASEILIGLPTELLRQRPDVRSAERELAAQTARIGVATAELYPSFSLNGSFEFAAYSSSSFFSSGNKAWGVGPTFRWNLFDGGRVRSLIRVEDARAEQAAARYEHTILRAMEEVEDAMVAFVEESARREALTRSTAAAQKSSDLVLILYRTGLTDFQNVLDMDRSLFLEQDALGESEGRVSQNLIRIYKALGGGWAADELSVTASSN